MNATKLTKTFLILATLLPVSVLGQAMDHSGMSHDNEQQQYMNHDSAAKTSSDNKSGHMMNDEQTGHEEQHDMTSMKPGRGAHEGDDTSMMMQRLHELPASGKSREANYDGTYMMHSTAISQSLNYRCALASRGLIMLDNESWAKCGGKPKGWSKGISDNQSSKGHDNHKNRM